MARSTLLLHYGAAVFLILTLQYDSPAAAQSAADFQSINCGGEAYNDSITRIMWSQDPLNQYDRDETGYYGRRGKIQQDSSLQTNITPVYLRTLRYFPRDKRNSKFCYTFPQEISSGHPYLVRASFLYGNYDGLNQPPSFVLILNYGIWQYVNTSSSNISVVHELIFISTTHKCIVCLAPHDTPFISTLELRPLQQDMYNRPYNYLASTNLSYGLMLYRRINYGATTSAAIRFPDDEYDRIWEANTTGPIITSTRSSMDTNIDYFGDAERPPPKVMATAITTQHPKDNLTFVFEGFGGSGGFRIEMHFQEVEEVSVASDLRNFSLAFPTSPIQLPNPYYISVPAPNAPVSVYLDQQLEFALPFQIALIPAAASAGSNARGPLLNAIELYQWTPQQLPATGTFQEDDIAARLIQRHYKLVGYGQGDPCLPFGHSWSWISCNQDLPPRIIEIDLSSFNLTGVIPYSFINILTYLEKLDLSNNMISGSIPDFNTLHNLKYLDFHNNNLTGMLPNNLLLLKTLGFLNVDNNDLCGSTSPFQHTVSNFTYIGNPRLCMEKTCICSSNVTSNSSTLDTPKFKKCNSKKYIYAIVFLGGLYIVTLLVQSMARQRRRNQGASTVRSNRDNQGANDLKSLPFTTKVFTYDEIFNATLGFTNLLGEGGFGKVYHGLLPSGDAIAVKLLANASKQGLKEFSTEVAILSRVRHKNLVSLIGYCVENTYMLIYEYISEGNLQDLIYGEVESSKRPLPWLKRLQIALDTAQGLEYLHSGCDPMIIHRDVKSSNILLSDKLQAKVADFGLSRLKEGDNTSSHVSTLNVVGTAGYLDPRYNATNQLTDKSDVYSFGVVLFELICGRPPIDMQRNPTHIVDWVSIAITQGTIIEFVDPTLGQGYKIRSIWKVVDLASRCVDSYRSQRPKMSQVVEILQQALELEVDPDL